MLPVVIYEPDETERSRILLFLREFDPGGKQRLSIVGNTTSLQRASTCLTQEKGILLLIIGITAGAGAEPARLEQEANNQNRDSYCLYWLHAMEDLPEIAAACRHPAGFILPPPDQAHFHTVLRRVLEDYDALTNDPGDSFVSLQCGGTTHRLSVRNIDYIEALDKKLCIYTSRQCLTVYESLSRMEKMLGSAFFRCHRSYLINFSHLANVDYAAMEIRLRGGIRLPLARSAKDRLKQRMHQEGNIDGC